MRLPGLFWYCLFLHVLILKKHNNSNLSFWRHFSKPTLEGFPCRCVWRWPWLWCLQPEECSWQWRCRLRCQQFLAAVKDLNNEYRYIHDTVIWSYIKYINLYKGILNLVFLSSLLLWIPHLLYVGMLKFFNVLNYFNVSFST